MLNRLIRFIQPDVREFRKLSIGDVPRQLLDQYNNPIYLTPRYQKIPYTEDFLKYIRYMQRSNSVSYTDMRQFVENLLAQYHTIMQQDRPKANIIMERKKVIPKNAACYFHGEVDWMYSANGYNMTPVMFFPQGINPAAGIGMAISNMHIRLAMRQAALKQFPNEDKKYQHANSYEVNNVKGYAILTTGHEWQMIRVDKYLKLQKTVFLEGRNKYGSLHHDEEMISVVLGLFDYCLQLPQLNVRVLEKGYQYLDERKFMIEGKDEKQANTNTWLTKLLIAYYKKRM